MKAFELNSGGVLLAVGKMLFGKQGRESSSSRRHYHA